MICFFSDNHYNAFPGKNIFGALPEERKKNIVFRCDDWKLLESGVWEKDCGLLILNMIGGTCGQPHPGPGAEQAVRRYCLRGGNMLLLHGSSAAFWQWDWWRKIVGLRWVRPGDPDGAVPSTHPKEPYTVEIAKTRHALAKKLRPLNLPEDEIYTELEQTSPIEILMTTKISGGTFPQAYETATPWGGRVIGFLPGHGPQVTRDPDVLYDILVLIDSLLEKKN